MDGWIFGWLVIWLVGYSVGWIFCGLFGYFVGWVDTWLVGYLVGLDLVVTLGVSMIVPVGRGMTRMVRRLAVSAVSWICF